MKQKYCPACEKKINTDQFYKSRKSPDGYRYCCKKHFKQKYKPVYKYKTDNPLLSDTIKAVLSEHKTTKVLYFGFFVGVIAKLSEEYLVFSTLGKSKVCGSIAESKLWLYNRVMQAGKRINQAMSKHAEKMLKKFSG